MTESRRTYDAPSHVAALGTKLLHSTTTSSVRSILDVGLQPVCGYSGDELVFTDPVHLSTKEEIDLIIFFQPDPDEVETVTVLEVDVSGLELTHPGPDGDHHYMCYTTIDPGRITVVSSCTEEYAREQARS